MHCEILNSITLRSDGKITCEASLGYDILLGEVLPNKKWKIADLTSGSIYRHIRDAFGRGTVPWIGTCEGCDVLSSGDPANDTLGKSIRLRIEPTLQCKLSCPSCKRNRAIRNRNENWYLSSEILDSLLSACLSDKLSIESVIFLGWGEPLEHPNFIQLVQAVRNAYPLTRIEVTTHGNVDYSATLFGCHVDDLIVSVDGAMQESYEKYRRGGVFSTTVEFMRAAVKDGQNVTWKYIVFNHNDSEEEIAKAQALAKEMDVSHLLFILTNSKGKSERFSPSNIAEFPLLSERVSVSPAAALQRSVTAYVPHAQFSRLNIADAPHFNIDCCFLTNSGLLVLEGWACERDGQPLHKITLRVDGQVAGELGMLYSRRDVVAVFDFPQSIRPGFTKWLPIQHIGNTFCVEFDLHAAAGVTTLSYICAVTGINTAGSSALSSATVTNPDAAGQYTGLWWNPNESGWGMSITQHGNMIFAVPYTYDSTGQPTWFAMSSCPILTVGSCTGDIYEVTGGSSPAVSWNGAGKVVSSVGTGTLTFDDDNHGRFAYILNGVSGSKSIERQYFSNGTPQFAIDYTDLWWNAGESGWGVALTQDHGMIFAAWYAYNDKGEAIWFIASSCPLSSNHSSGNGCSGDLYQVTGGSPLTATWDGSNKAITKVGSVTFIFFNANNGLMSYTLNGVAGNRTITRHGF